MFNQPDKDKEKNLDSIRFAPDHNRYLNERNNPITESFSPDHHAYLNESHEENKAHAEEYLFPFWDEYASED